MDEFIDCFYNLNIEHGFVTLSQKNKPLLSYKGHFFRLKETKQDLTVTKKFGWRCTYPSCSSNCETMNVLSDLLMMYLSNKEYKQIIKEVARMSNDNPRKIIATIRSDVLLKDEEAF
ncbi:hypothetical protein BpHYR1_028810 [Brachionus plicatilis]|uniref:FLYWCH-type domain-containing protein n=1 Tax=Brachionus plicatilis TaxID=10195 RepID=A0A3M7PCU6_BRAPC|nr:hypothetical protein BpHYR1_028810 [Brachionus plicatilis]